MELATPNKEEIFAFISDFSYTSTNNISDKLTRLKEEINHLIDSFGFRNLTNIINNKKQTIDNYIFRIQSNIGTLISKKKNEIAILSKTIELNNIDHILKRGFVIVEQNKNFIKRKRQFELNKEFNLKFADGNVVVNK